MITGFLTIGLLQWCVLLSSFSPQSLGMPSFAVHKAQRRHSTFKVREPNLYAPHLYAHELEFLAILVDLPGAKKKQSYWELSYQLYFVSEDKYYETVKRLPRGPSNPTPEQFPGRVLLLEGHKKIRRLDTLRERTIHLTRVPFKQRVPDAQRTKFATLMTYFSVKIFDAELKTTLYRTGLMITDPFEDHPQDPNQAIARKTIYLNFMVTPEGYLNLSQLARDPDSTKW
jgi:hypothetical protein